MKTATIACCAQTMSASLCVAVACHRPPVPITRHSAFRLHYLIAITNRSLYPLLMNRLLCYVFALCLSLAAACALAAPDIYERPRAEFHTAVEPADYRAFADEFCDLWQKVFVHERFVF